MVPGTKVLITSTVAPHGTVFASLEADRIMRSVGTVKTHPDAAGYCLVELPTLPSGDRMSVHVSMMTTTTRKH